MVLFTNIYILQIDDILGLWPVCDVQLRAGASIALQSTSPLVLLNALWSISISLVLVLVLLMLSTVTMATAGKAMSQYGHLTTMAMQLVYKYVQTSMT